LGDLRGRRANTPIAKLLDDNVDICQKIPTYVTVFDEQDTRDALDNGVHAIKLHVERFGFPPDVVALTIFVEQVRNIVGPETEIMMDAFGRWDVESTLAVANSVKPFDVAWIEEPVPPNRFEDYSYLMENSPVPIAGGEHEYLKEGFEFLIQNKLHKILQPDINWCGGMTTLVQIYQLARAANLQVCPHRGSEPYALHAIAALDPQPLAESGRTWFNCLAGAPEIIAGKISLSDRPGFGVQFDF
ncbi:MAG: L-rhamnonate dehydratase, partial [Pirellulaceae bacterium]